MEPTPDKFSPTYLAHEDFYIGVGLSISRWSHMETTIVRIFSVIMRTEEKKAGIVFYSIMNFNTWLMVISDLIAIDPAFKKHAGNWNKKVDRLRRLNDTRVRLAHHTVWEEGEPLGLKPSRLDARPKSLAHQPMSLDEIVEFIQLSFEMHMDLWQFLKTLAIEAAAKPSPDKSEPPPDDPRPSDAQ